MKYYKDALLTSSIIKPVIGFINNYAGKYREPYKTLYRNSNKMAHEFPHFCTFSTIKKFTLHFVLFPP